MASDYVIMLDDYLDVYPSYWPISEDDSTLEGIRKKKEHDGSPALYPRKDFTMIIGENKSLINKNTLAVDKGAIYRRTPSE